MAHNKIGIIAKTFSFGSVQDGWHDKDATVILTKEEVDDPPVLTPSFSSDLSQQSEEKQLISLASEQDELDEVSQSDSSICSHTNSKYRATTYHHQRHRRMTHRYFADQVLRAMSISFCCSVLLIAFSTLCQSSLAPPRKAEQFRHLLRRVHLHSHHPQYTVLIRGDRLDATFRAVHRYLDCPNALTVKVDWSKDEQYPPILTEYTSAIETDAILALDERQIVSCDDLDRSFAVWRADPSRMVGDPDGVMVVHKWFWKTKRWNSEVPLLGLSQKSSHNIWYLGKRYHR